GLLHALDDPEIAVDRSLAEHAQRFLVRSAVVAGSRLRHAGEFDHHGPHEQAALVRVRRGAAREELAAGRVDRGPGELRVGRELLGIVDRAVEGNPIPLRHGITSVNEWSDCNRARAYRWAKSSFNSFPLAACANPSKRPSLAIVRAARMKPAQAQRASAPPTLTRRTPIASTSFNVNSLVEPMSRFTGLGATAATTAVICSRVRMPGAYRQSAPASEYALSRTIVSPMSGRPRKKFSARPMSRVPVRLSSIAARAARSRANASSIVRMGLVALPVESSMEMPATPVSIAMRTLCATPAASAA